MIDKQTALIIVDVQNDFCPNGALPVPKGNEIISILNKYIEKFQKANALICFTRDWHPKNHISFKKYGGIWPSHCIQGTFGAEFHPDLKIPKNAKIFSKAFNPKKEVYSGFKNSDLQNYLKEKGIKKIFIGGLATEYCVKETILDAIKLGYKVFFLEDASRGINPIEIKKTINEILSKGVKIINLEFNY